MITSFGDKETAKVFKGEFSKKLPREIQRGAQQKMIILDKTEDIKSLWALPGMRAEKLTVKGVSNLWSVRINGQWRICFLWTEDPPQAANVEIVDYH